MSLPRPFVAPNDSLGFALQKRVKWMHYWIRKGHSSKAANAAREAIHFAGMALARGLDPNQGDARRRGGAHE